MEYDAFEQYLVEQGITVSLRGDEIVLDGPVGTLSDEIRELLRKHHSRLTRRLRAQRNQLSWFQERLWFLHERDPEDLSYNIPILLELRGPLDVAALRQSLQTIVSRQHSLRTAYEVASDGIVGQRVVSADTFELELRSCKPEAVSEQVRAVVEHHFALSRGRPFLARLLRLEEERHLLLLNVHHIAADGWSMKGVFLRELRRCYDAFHDGKQPNLPRLSHQYIDFARAQRAHDVSPGLDYFVQKLRGYEDTLELPSDFLRTPHSGRTSARLVQHFPVDFARTLEHFSRQRGVTVFMTLLAALSVTVARYTGRDDICLGTTTSGRDRVEWEALIGFFINIVALRLSLDEDQTVAELIEQVRRVTIEGFEHQAVPFEQVLKRGGFSDPGKQNPLVPLVIRHQNFPSETMSEPLSGGVTLAPYQGEGSASDGQSKRKDVAARCEIEFSYIGSGENLKVEIVYASDVYEAATIQRLLSHQSHVLEQMIATPELPLVDLHLLTPQEQLSLIEAPSQNHPGLSGAFPFTKRFSAQADGQGEAICCVDGEGTWSFSRVETKSNQLAHLLIDRGVRPGDVVGVCLERGGDLLVCLLAIWKAGAGYVPLDPNYPESYLRQIESDAGPTLIVTRAAHQDRLRLPPDRSVLLDREVSEQGDAPHYPPPIEQRPDSLAYVMYTSGSTGVPKGVRVPHRQLMNWMAGIEARWPFEPNEIVAQKTTMAFAVSVKELFAGVLSGCPLVFLDDATVKDVAALHKALAKHSITRLNLVPSHLAVLLSHLQEHELRLPALRILITAGEPLTAEVALLCRELLPHVRLLNNYGCTEINDITYYDASDYEKGQGFLPIGKPIPNTRVYVLDRKGRLVPDGVAGELHVASLSMSDGYHGLDELTREKYQKNPFAGAPLDRMYNTGDVVRRLHDGNLDYIGRWDFQVKVRGFRVDVRHVEKVMGDYAGVGARAVVGNDQRLVAFYVTRADAEVELGQLRQFLRERLPSYMVPDAFVRLDSLPRLPNGKLDRRALRPQDQPLAQSESHRFLEGATELALSEIWADVLDVPKDALGRQSDFFEMGGHSLSATRVVARIKDRFFVELPLGTLFDHPLLESLARQIDEASARGETPKERWSLSQGDAPPTVAVGPVRLLAGKVALVTGASRGIGQAVALCLAQAGAKVAINFRDSERQALEVKAQIEESGGIATVVRADVTESEQVRAMVAQIEDTWDSVDILVANASISFKKQPFSDYAWGDLEAKVSSELKALFHPCQAVLPAMKKKGTGSIIALSSALSKNPSPGFVAQSTAKAALDAFVRSLAVELGDDGIRINTVAPGVTGTDAAANMPQHHKDKTADRTPLGRNGTPNDMAGAVLFLASDWSRFMTGAYLPVDGGFTML